MYYYQNKNVLFSQNQASHCRQLESRLNVKIIFVFIEELIKQAKIRGKDKNQEKQASTKAI